MWLVFELLSSALRSLRLCGERLTRILFVAALVLPVPGFGRSDDAKQPIHVEADSAELNEASGVGVYRGDVRITQGSMVLTADEVTIIAPGRELQKLIATSDDQDEKARFRQLTDTGDELTARSRRMEYEPGKKQITLLTDAVLRNAGNRFAAERIVYHIDRQVVDADGGDGGERVKMTLVPEDDAAQPSDGQ